MIYFTVTGADYYYGTDFMKRNMPVFLEKEPDNEYDREAISVTMPGLGKVGYVANSTKTVKGESFSAGRLYDRMGKKARGKILYVFDGYALAYITEEKASRVYTRKKG